MPPSPPASDRSSAPPAPAPAPAKTPSSRMSKARSNGSQKPKGAVRAKSGCYTCRIRRKKCDEKPDAEGNCQTCVRLRLQCLGFGAKRPDWMREGNNVLELREKIKNFLASQGMIKGHSGQPSSSAHRAASGSDNGDNLGSPGATASSSFVGSSSAAVLAPSSSANPSALSSGPNGNSVLVLSSSLHRPYGMNANSPPARTQSISPGHGAGAIGGGSGGSFTTSTSHLRYPQHHHHHQQQQQQHAAGGPTRGGGRGGYPSSISTSVGTGAGAATAGLDGYLHSPHSRRSPLDSSADERNNLLNFEHDPYTSRPASVTGHRTYLTAAPHFQPMHGNALSLNTHNMVAASAGMPSPCTSAAGSSPGASNFLRTLNRPPYTPGPEPPLDLDVKIPTPDDYSTYNRYDYSVASMSYAHSSFAYGAHQAVHHSPQFNGLQQISPDSPKPRLQNNLMLSGHQMGGHQGHLAAEQYHLPYEGANSACMNANGNYTMTGPPQLTHHNHSDTTELAFFKITQTYPQLPAPVQSTFSPLYSMQIQDDPDQNGMANMHGPGALGALISYTGQEEPAQTPPLAIYPLVDLNMFPSPEISSLISHYLNNVRPMQYFFADNWIDDTILQSAYVAPIVRDSICLVASVHKRRWRDSESPPATMRLIPLPDGDDTEAKMKHVRQRLLDAFSKVKENNVTPAEALAGLQCVSSFLFAGGIGEWDKFLDVACKWVKSCLSPLRRPVEGFNAILDTLDTLSHFVVKATMWFEVLASVTQIKRPRFMDIYDEVFSPRFELMDAEGYDTGRLTMLNVMGCDDRSFLAIAKISELAAWKDRHTKDGTLDVTELVERGSEIREEFFGRAVPLPSVRRFTIGLDGSYVDDLNNRRQLTADIFRSAAQLYLDVVIHGDKPTVRKISLGVERTMDALRSIPEEPQRLRESVIRSVVFPVCIAGCMTDDVEHRKTLLSMLQGTQGAGNCSAVAQVMQGVWAKRDQPSKTSKAAQEVGWRQALRENGALLLV